jgi:putative Mg2+ transporter-C (MgtC) family protein
MRSLLLRALSQSGRGLRHIENQDIPDISKVAITVQAVAAKRNDAALEQIVGRLSLEPHVTAATWQVDRTPPGGLVRCHRRRPKRHGSVFCGY